MSYHILPVKLVVVVVSLPPKVRPDEEEEERGAQDEEPGALPLQKERKKQEDVKFVLIKDSMLIFESLWNHKPYIFPYFVLFSNLYI